MVKCSRMYLLEAGQVIFSESPICIRTVLGSCVAVTFFEPKSKTAAIMHGLYPGIGQTTAYTETAINKIILEYKHRGIELNRVEVKLFGGAVIQLADNPQNVSSSIKIENVRSAKKILDAYKLKIIAEDSGGTYGRELRFYTDTGDVYIKRLQK